MPLKQSQCNPMGACDLKNPKRGPGCPVRERWQTATICSGLPRSGGANNSLRSDNGPALSDLNRPDQMALPAKIRSQASRARSTVPPYPGLASQLW